MFKQATFLRLTKASEDMADAMDSQQFTPLGASTQDKSVGWVQPRGEAHGALLERVGDFVFAKLAIETKTVPSSEVNKKLDEVVAQIEEQTGRKPGKKERRELKQDVITALLPNAFPKRKDVAVMIDSVNGYVVIDSASQSVVDEVITFLVRAGLELALVQTNTNPNGFMAQHLVEDEASGSPFFVGRECELVSTGEDKARVTFKNHFLLTQEIHDHLLQGKQVISLALTDERDTSFVLTETLRLKKLKFAVPEAPNGEEQDRFDADAILCGSALSSLITDLVQAMGGLYEQAEPSAPEPHTDEGPDPLYESATQLVMNSGKASISLVQRHLSIGYNRAARMLEQMEVDGLVSPMRSDGSRKILEEA